MDGGNWLGMRFLPAKPLIAMSLQPDKRLFNLTAVFPAQNGYLRPDVWETTSHLSQGDIRSLQQITQQHSARQRATGLMWQVGPEVLRPSSLTKLSFDHSG